MNFNIPPPCRVRNTRGLCKVVPISIGLTGSQVKVFHRFPVSAYVRSTGVLAAWDSLFVEVARVPDG